MSMTLRRLPRTQRARTAIDGNERTMPPILPAEPRNGDTFRLVRPSPEVRLVTFTVKYVAVVEGGTDDRC